ncbi:MAG TPA: helix-turn-helix transcriptional regulator [Candidatus Acidoferrales bacterium]|nr:helix-turn-helix transcriptional regulator [Candidatus Acidoferrales bacterium]
MQPAERRRLFELLARLTQALGQGLGGNCEVVLHDFQDPESSIVAIANGQLTGRKVGDTLDALGFQLLREPPARDLVGYRSKTRGGRELRSTSIFVRDEEGKVIGALCINLDLSAPIKFQEWLRETVNPQDPEIDEKFEHSVEEVLEGLVQSAIRAIGKEASEFTREDKIAIISQLESKGAFLIRYSVDRVADLLGLSKYTIYNYLDEVKSRQSNAKMAPARAGAE